MDAMRNTELAIKKYNLQLHFSDTLTGIWLYDNNLVIILNDNAGMHFIIQSINVILTMLENELKL